MKTVEDANKEYENMVKEQYSNITQYIEKVKNNAGLNRRIESIRSGRRPMDKDFKEILIHNIERINGIESIVAEKVLETILRGGKLK
jgi:hypothetical protein